MRLTLKSPGTERLKLSYVRLLSIFAFKFNLRRYYWAWQEAVAGRVCQIMLATS
jgi:hypothetical protein